MNDILGSTERWLAAAAILLIGALVAAAVGALVTVVTRRVLGDRQRAARLASTSVWIVLIMFAVAALSRLLGPEVAQPGLSAAATQLLARIPDVLIALLLVVGGLVLAHAVRLIARRMLQPTQPSAAGVVGAAGYWVVLGLAILLAADQVGIAVGTAERLLLLIVGAVLLAAALAVGFGLRGLISAVVAGRHVEQVLGVGDEVEIAGYRGTVVALGHASVRLKLAAGEAEIPHGSFLSTPVLIHQRSTE